MDRQEFLKINEDRIRPFVLHVRMLKDQSDRTLLYGYNCDRSTWHVYMLKGTIYLHHYTPDSQLRKESCAAWEASELIPDKRLYPEACDAEMCKLLAGFGVHLPFTTFNEARPKSQFYGRL